MLFQFVQQLTEICVEKYNVGANLLVTRHMLCRNSQLTITVKNINLSRKIMRKSRSPHAYRFREVYEFVREQYFLF